MSEPQKPERRRGWTHKFRDAFRGTWLGARGQASFGVHLTVTAAVVLQGWWLQVTRVEWCLLILCITLVLTAEMFNSALEAMGKAFDTEFMPQLGQALDIGSAAVLIASVGAAVAGAIVLLYRWGGLVEWWI